MSDIVRKVEFGYYTIKIVYDTSPHNPREWSNACMLELSGHLGDNNFIRENDEPDNWVDIQEALENRFEVRYWRPLYCKKKRNNYYLTLKSQLSDYPNDKKMRGFAIITDENIETMGLENKNESELHKIVKGEIRIYEKFLNGEVYAYKLERNNQQIDSLWGIYDIDTAIAEARNMIYYNIREENKHEYPRLCNYKLNSIQPGELLSKEKLELAQN